MINWFKKYFIPHKENGHRPLFLSKDILQGIIVFVIFFEIFTFLIPTLSEINKNGGMAAVLPSILSDLTNEERQNSNLNTLVINPILNNAAQLKAEDMAEKGYFAHTSPEGKTPWYWLNEVGYNYQYAGENLAINFNDSIDVTNAWMNSPTHKSNITKENYTEIGTGMAIGMYKGKEAIYVAQVYANPLLNNQFNKIVNTITPKAEATNKIKNNINVLGVETNKTIDLKNTQTENTNIIKTENLKLITDNEVKKASFWQKIFTSPRNSTNIILFIISGIMILAVMLNIFIEIKHHHLDLLTNALFVFAILGALFVANYYLSNKNMVIIDRIDYSLNENDSISMCYYESKLKDNNLFDTNYLKFDILGNNINGEYNSIPYQKNSKTGLFYGTISNTEDLDLMSNANVLWKSTKKGIENTEELVFKFDEKGAKIGFGEMVLGEDNTYVYKDKDNLYFSNLIPKIECELLNDILSIN